MILLLHVYLSFLHVCYVLLWALLWANTGLGISLVVQPCLKPFEQG